LISIILLTPSIVLLGFGFGLGCSITLIPIEEFNDFGVWDLYLELNEGEYVKADE
jgi:hypothetical protein